MQQQISLQNERLEQQNEVEVTVPIATPSPSAQDTQPTRQKAKLPELPEFKGKRSEFRPWTTQVKAKLAIDKAGEPEHVQFWYVHSRLREGALEQVSSWVSSVEGTDAMTVQNLLAQLKAAYDDVEATERASRKLAQLKQGGRSFNNFLAEFDRTLLDAGGLNWNDQVKKTFLGNCLSTELHTAIVATPVPATYRAYCELL
jgi:hypothetical protein